MSNPKDIQKCLSCGHPVAADDPGVSIIQQSRQAKYYHTDPRACADAETNPYDMYYTARKKITA